MWLVVDPQESTGLNMARIRRRKEPVTAPSNTTPSSSKHLSGPNIIRRFHVLLKRRQALLAAGTTSKSKELEEIEREMEELGGLETYQRMSVRGQDEERGGGSEKVLIHWLREEGKDKAGAKLKYDSFFLLLLPLIFLLGYWKLEL